MGPGGADCAGACGGLQVKSMLGIFPRRANDDRRPGQTCLTHCGGLCKVRQMKVATGLQPSLWRTCRVLANRTRLRLFQLLARRPDLAVSAVAGQLNLPVPVASQYLRALEARGLLAVRRSGARVKYRLKTAEPGSASTLVAPLRLALQPNSGAVETVFKLATAFTQSRRIEVFRVLNARPATFEQLLIATGISKRALIRHLWKLETRGFVSCQSGVYTVTNRRDVLGRELARLAIG
ncbi:MAG: ArsR family transcriptional regulator [Pedosphaera sp.]|nr:ArsR family transcriptional regulator [Pedosphaera sp.]